MRIGGVRFGWLRRRWWLLVVSVAGVVGLAMALAPPQETSYTANSVLFVRSGATANTPGAANEANRLAVTYAQSVNQDAGIIGGVSRALNIPPAQVEDSITASNVANTSVLQLQFTSSDRNRAIAGARATAEALAGPTPASPNFNGLAITRLADTAASSTPGLSTLPTAAVLGLMLGAVLIVMWERIDARIDDRYDIERAVTVPVSSLEELTNESISALVERWQTMVEPDVLRAALLTVNDGNRELTSGVAAIFDEITRESATGDRSALGPASFVSAGAPGTNEVGEAAAQRANLSVLVVPQRSSAASVRTAINTLANYGTSPSWVLFASSKVVRHAKKRSAKGRHLVVDVNEATPAPSQA